MFSLQLMMNKVRFWNTCTSTNELLQFRTASIPRAEDGAVQEREREGGISQNCACSSGRVLAHLTHSQQSLEQLRGLDPPQPLSLWDRRGLSPSVQHRTGISQGKSLTSKSGSAQEEGGEWLPVSFSCSIFPNSGISSAGHARAG